MIQKGSRKVQMRRQGSEQADGGQVMTLAILLKMLIVSYFITGVLLLFLALLLYKFHLSDQVVTAAIIVIYILSTFFTGFLAGKKIGHQKYLWGLCLGGIYFAVLVLVSLCIRHSFSDLSQNFLFTMFLCLASGMLGGMLG